MRHKIAGNKLNRNSSWRKATIRDIAKATLLRQKICTTTQRAKEARKLVDQLITLGKKGTLAHKRQAFAILCDHKLVSVLFKETAPRFRERNGGYTRIIPSANRKGDNAQLSYLELTEKTVEIVRSKKTVKGSVKEDQQLDKKAGKTKTDKVVESVEVKNDVSADKVEKKQSNIASPKTKNLKDTQNPKDKKILGGIRKLFNRKRPDGK